MWKGMTSAPALRCPPAQEEDASLRTNMGLGMANLKHLKKGTHLWLTTETNNKNLPKVSKCSLEND
jgi:hypothetical protein